MTTTRASPASVWLCGSIGSRCAMPSLRPPQAPSRSPPGADSPTGSAPCWSLGVGTVASWPSSTATRARCPDELAGLVGARDDNHTGVAGQRLALRVDRLALRDAELAAREGRFALRAWCEQHHGLGPLLIAGVGHVAEL